MVVNCLSLVISLRTIRISPLLFLTEGRPKSSSEEQAHTLVEQIAQQAAEHNYTLHGTPERQGEGWIVQVIWTSSAWKRDLKLAIRSLKQWEQVFREWQEIVQIAEQKQRSVK